MKKANLVTQWFLYNNYLLKSEMRIEGEIEITTAYQGDYSIGLKH